MKHTLEIIMATVTAALAIGVLSPQVADADERADADQSESSYHWGIGIGGGILRQAYTDIDDDNLVIPLIYFENRRVRVLGGNVDLKLPSLGPVEFSLAARYTREGYEASDSRFLVGMTERESSAWIGAAATWSNPVANVSVEWLTDAMTNSEGQHVKLELQHGFEAGKFEFTPRVGATWMDSKFVDYYYGVTAAEARIGRPTFIGESSTSIEVGLRTSYAPAPHQNVFLDISSEQFAEEIEDSPLLDQANRSRLMLGYLYVF